MSEEASVTLSDPHVVKALEYARAIVDGSIPASKLTQLACQRQLDDLEKWATDPNYPLEFSEAAASRPCRFIELLPHVKGPKANASENIVLEPWQCFVITTIYGWVKKETGKRRFRRAYIEVSRGNGKSIMLSGLALYALAADGEEGAEVVSAATTRDQAKIVFSVAQGMLRKRPALVKRLGIRDTQHAMLRPASNGRFVPLSREADNQDGLNLHFACVDELHAHNTRDTYDILETALGKRDQSMLVVITTAGVNMSGICYEIRSYCVKLLEGSFTDDAQFALVYTIDPSDDWTDPIVWRKANPNWGVSVMPDVITSLALKAQQIASAQNNFKTKHLNVWCNADVSWLNMQAWDACGDPTLSEDDFLGQDTFIGFDLASRSDMACRAKFFYRDFPHRRQVGGLERHWYLFVDSYLPEEVVEQSYNASYEGWAREGWIKTSPGAVLDFALLKEDTLNDRDKFRIREAPYDPYQATQFASELAAAAVPMVEFRNTVLAMSPPMKELEALVMDGRLHHNANPLMRWMISNVVCHRDAKDNVFPRKQRPEQKIDGPVAAIMALGRAMLSDGEIDPYLAGSGFRTLG